MDHLATAHKNRISFIFKNTDLVKAGNNFSLFHTSLRLFILHPSCCLKPYGAKKFRDCCFNPSYALLIRDRPEMYIDQWAGSPDRSAPDHSSASCQHAACFLFSGTFRQTNSAVWSASWWREGAPQRSLLLHLSWQMRNEERGMTSEHHFNFQGLWNPEVENRFLLRLAFLLWKHWCDYIWSSSNELKSKWTGTEWHCQHAHPAIIRYYLRETFVTLIAAGDTSVIYFRVSCQLNVHSESVCQQLIAQQHAD